MLLPVVCYALTNDLKNQVYSTSFYLSIHVFNAFLFASRKRMNQTSETAQMICGMYEFESSDDAANMNNTAIIPVIVFKILFFIIFFSYCFDIEWIADIASIIFFKKLFQC